MVKISRLTAPKGQLYPSEISEKAQALSVDEETFFNKDMKRMQKPTIRLAEPSDGPRLTKLAVKTFREAFAHMNNREDFENYVAGSFSQNQIRSELLDSTSTFFIAAIEDQWVGYAKLSRSPTPDCVDLVPAIELARLYSLQEYLGRGIGPALLSACLQHARNQEVKSVWLGSWKKNDRGNAFYAKMQFEIKGNKTFAVGTDIQEDYVFVRPLS